ncbi:hypothetical protein DMENIID0001_115370 [Sergentomyia squamirostris]
MDEESEKVLKKVLEVVEINQIPQEIQKKLEDFYEQRLNEFYTAKALQLNIEGLLKSENALRLHPTPTIRQYESLRSRCPPAFGSSRTGF